MKKSRYTEEQIIAILKQHEPGSCGDFIGPVQTDHSGQVVYSQV